MGSPPHTGNSKSDALHEHLCAAAVQGSYLIADRHSVLQRPDNSVLTHIIAGDDPDIPPQDLSGGAALQVRGDGQKPVEKIVIPYHALTQSHRIIAGEYRDVFLHAPPVVPGPAPESLHSHVNTGKSGKGPGYSCVVVLPQVLYLDQKAKGLDGVIVLDGHTAFSPALPEFKGLVVIAAELPVDGGHLPAPAPPLPVVKLHQRVVGPVQIVGQKRHLLIQTVLRIEQRLALAPEGERAVLPAGDPLPAKTIGVLPQFRRPDTADGQLLIVL